MIAENKNFLDKEYQAFEHEDLTNVFKTILMREGRYEEFKNEVIEEFKNRE